MSVRHEHLLLSANPRACWDCRLPAGRLYTGQKSAAVRAQDLPCAAFVAGTQVGSEPERDHATGRAGPGDGRPDRPSSAFGAVSPTAASRWADHDLDGVGEGT